MKQLILFMAVLAMTFSSCKDEGGLWEPIEDESGVIYYDDNDGVWYIQSYPLEPSVIYTITNVDKFPWIINEKAHGFVKFSGKRKVKEDQLLDWGCTFGRLVSLKLTKIELTPSYN